MSPVRGRTLLLALLACVSATGLAHAQPRWITDVDAEALDQSRAPVSLQFRREFDLGSRPRSFIVHVSADNRFVLFVNGARLGAGPARGDLRHWRYETFDIASALKSGRNVIAAQVWNDGRAAPLAQVSSGRTGFWLRAQDESQARLVETDTTWRVRIDRSRTIEAGRQQITRSVGGGFYAAGPAETFDAALQSADWKEARTSSADWRSAVPLGSADAGRWALVPDQLPQMRLDQVPSGAQVRAAGVNGSGFPKSPLRVPARTEATILIDAGRVLAAYPVLVASGGAGATISVTYAEALYEPPSDGGGGRRGAPRRLADRAAAGNGVALGLTDTFKLDGASRQRFQPFWWRTWRFAQITVTTSTEPVTVERFETWETGYPFEQRGRVVSNDAELNEINTGPSASEPDNGAALTATAKNMSRYWSGFAKTGVPHADGQPAWPAYDLTRHPMMLLKAQCEVISDQYPNIRKVWSGMMERA